MSKRSRAERAGRLMGTALVEMVHLMYQKNTAKNFLRGLCDVLNCHWKEREHDAEGSCAVD